MNIAVKFGYDGWLFDGYANQNIRDPPRTVEGEVLKALGRVSGKRGGPEAVRKALSFASSSRTDKGVSAIGNVVAFRSDMDPPTVLRALNGMVDGCFFWAYGQVPQGFKPRQASARLYRYTLKDMYTEAGFRSMIEAGAEFLGEHDFKAFSTRDRSEPEKGTIRSITDIRLNREGKDILIDIVSKSFLWHQVRKMVWALDQVGRGRMDAADIRRMLTGEKKGIHIGLVPAQNLVLMDVSFEDISFKRLAGPVTRPFERRRDALEAELDFIKMASVHIKCRYSRSERHLAGDR